MPRSFRQNSVSINTSFQTTSHRKASKNKIHANTTNTPHTFPFSHFQLECGPMPNMMAAQPNIGGALCESSLYHAAKFGWRPLLACYSLKPYRRKQELDTKWILHLAKFRQRARDPENEYIMYQPRRRPNIVQSLVHWLATGERRRCSDEAKMRNPLKFAGVPQTPEPISADSGPKFAIL